MLECYFEEGQMNSVEYGYLPGKMKKLLLIKTGAGGSIHGYQNKYLRIAEHF